MKKIITGFLGGVLACTMPVVHAENLVQVYQQALKNDPTYKQARAQMLTDKAQRWIARTGYFPIIGAQGIYNRNFTNTNTSIFNNAGPISPVGAGATTPGHKSFSPWNYSLTLSQPIVSFPTLANMQTADYEAQSAGLTFLYARQQLIQRTTKAYFSILQAYDTLRHDVTYVSALYQRYVTSEQKYKVGLSAKTDVYQAQSRYDTQISAEITDRNILADALEDLRAITGTRYSHLSGINIQVPLVKPNPANQNSWVSAAIRQNYNLHATSLTAQQAKEQIKVLSAAVLPSLSATGGFTGGENTTNGAPTSTGYVGLALNFNFTGGSSFAYAAQQRHQYMVAVDALEFIHRQLVTSTRNDYLNVLSAISAVKADQASINSSRSSFAAIEAGYRVGTTDMNTLLAQLANLYEVLQQHATDQYKFLNSTISLKLDAGTLNENDVKILNSWLKIDLNVNPKTALVCKGGKPCSDVNILTNEIPGVKIPAMGVETPSNNKANKPSNRQPTNKLKTQKPSSMKKYPVNKKMQGSHLKINEYTLQLFAASDLASTQDYVNSLPVNSNITILHIRPWYKVVYGRYKTHEAAQAALNQLKPIYTKDSPWVYKIQRSIATKPAVTTASPAVKQTPSRATKIKKTPAVSKMELQKVPQVTNPKIYQSGEQTLVQHLQKVPTHNTLPQPK